MDYKYLFSENYDKVYENKKNEFSCKYYSKSQIKSIYPNGGYKIIGQIGYGKDVIGQLQYSEKSEDIYAVKNSLIHKTGGYIDCGNDEFISVSKNIIALLLLFFFLFLALLALVVFGIRALIGGNNEPPTTKPYVPVDAEAKPGEGDISIPEKVETASKKIKINGIPEMRLKANQKSQSFVFSNAPENPCYFVIEIYLLGADNSVTTDDELVYKSNLLPPGYSISKFDLMRALNAGSYKTRINYVTYSFDKEQRPLNNMVINTDIIAE
ncbi:MAG: hypothetical protein RRZ68_03735 [Oscillospiraceae bacterium]